MDMFLIGEETSKRSIYFKQAAELRNVSFRQIEWNTIKDRFDLGQLQGAVVKIDPPSYKTVHLCNMQELLAEYRNDLQRLSQVQGCFLNAPEMIELLLDKRETKLRLQSHGVSVTEMFEEKIQTMEQLIKFMKEKRCYSVFVKPRYFSGAAGVAAVRMNPVREEVLVYTSCCLDGDMLVNTKKLSLLRDKEKIAKLMEQLLTLDCVVERWHPKSEFQKKSYDLRVVYQFGHIAYMVVRQAGGPITNLHLNNQALSIGELGLEQKKIEEIKELCKEAVALFPGLNMVGIDVLLEKGSLRPRIIEMNAQGDLIYQDIYGENMIYGEQIEVLNEWVWLNGCD